MATRTAASTAPEPSVRSEPRAHWGAVYAMALCSFVLVASEFMPVSLLSPIAQSLDLSEGQAGQAITASGIAALVTSLSVSSVMGRLDRRLAVAPTFAVLLVGRVLIGVAIGGFWSMSAAIAMRLVPERSVAKALAIINGGNALATTLAAPLGSFLGG